MTVSMIANMWHSSCHCLRHSWLTKFGVLSLNQLVHGFWVHRRFRNILTVCTLIWNQNGPQIANGLPYRLKNWVPGIIFYVVDGIHQYRSRYYFAWVEYVLNTQLANLIINNCINHSIGRTHSDALFAQTYQIDKIDHDLNHLVPRCEMVYRICIVSIQPRKYTVDDAGYMAPTRQHELDHTDHTDHTDQEYIYLLWKI